MAGSSRTVEFLTDLPVTVMDLPSLPTNPCRRLAALFLCMDVINLAEASVGCSRFWFLPKMYYFFCPISSPTIRLTRRKPYHCSLPLFISISFIVWSSFGDLATLGQSVSVTLNYLLCFERPSRIWHVFDRLLSLKINSI